MTVLRLHVDGRPDDTDALLAELLLHRFDAARDTGSAVPGSKGPAEIAGWLALHVGAAGAATAVVRVIRDWIRRADRPVTVKCGDIEIVLPYASQEQIDTLVRVVAERITANG